MLANSLVYANGSPVLDSETKSEIRYNQEVESTTTIIVNISSSKHDIALSCTIEGKVTVTTEDGDSISIEFKITADTCKEAIRVQSKIMEALE